MSYALIFWHMKGLIKIHNRGKFYEYSIFDCQVINFQSFSYQFSIHEMALFGEVLGPNSHKYHQILITFSPQVVFKETKTVLQESLKNSNFYRNGRYPEFALLVQLWPLFSPWRRWLNFKNKIILEEKIHPLGYPKIVKSRRISSPLQMKNRITFCTFWAFFGKNLSKVKS